MSLNLNLLHKYQSMGARYGHFPLISNWKVEKNCHFEENDGPNDLYVHIPFCPELCTFCGCHFKVTQNKSEVKKYIQFLIEEIKNSPNRDYQSVFIGGGTPNYTDAEDFDLLLETIFSSQNNQKRWLYIELDPRLFNHTSSWFEIIKKWKPDHLQFGIQDWNQKITENVNRYQDIDSIFEVFDQIKNISPNTIVGVDLIYGLPFQSQSSTAMWNKYLDNQFISFVSLYPLANVPWLKTAQDAYGQFEPLPPQLKDEIYLEACSILKSLDFDLITMGHFAKKDSIFHQEKLGRWTSGLTPLPSENLNAIGAGAMGDSNQIIFQNEKILDRYYYQIQHFGMPEKIYHIKNDIEKEFSMLSKEVITKNAILFNNFPRLNKSIDEAKRVFTPYIEDQLVYLDDSSLRISDLGRHFHKQICQNLQSLYF